MVIGPCVYRATASNVDRPDGNESLSGAPDLAGVQLANRATHFCSANSQASRFLASLGKTTHAASYCVQYLMLPEVS